MFEQQLKEMENHNTRLRLDLQKFLGFLGSEQVRFKMQQNQVIAYHLFFLLCIKKAGTGTMAARVPDLLLW